MSDVIWLKVLPLTHYFGPEWLKQAWQGCVLPCEKQAETIMLNATGIMPQDNAEVGDPANPRELREIPGYCIRQDAALLILDRKLSAAATWYRELSCPQPNGYFLFEKRDVEVIASAEQPTKLLR